MEYIKKTYNFKQRSSKTTKKTEYNNCCENCDALQGRYFLYEETNSPFWIQNQQDLNNLEFFSFPISNDFITNYSTLDMSSDYEITNNITEIKLF